MYVCICHAVNERRIESAAQEGVRSIKGLCMATRAGTCCGKCLPQAKECLERAVSKIDATNALIPQTEAVA